MSDQTDTGAVDASARAAWLLSQARRVVVLSGAGLSAESGISTFRDPEAGVWSNRLRLFWYGTPIGWKVTPGWSWSAYARLFRGPIAAAAPNDGHRAIAQMSELLGNIDVQIATQNVDSLHQRAGSPASTVYELHGSVFRHRCKNFHAVELPPGLEGFPASVPKCPQCHAAVRPDAVLFGESLPDEPWSKAVAATEALRRGDVFLVVGTSGVVYPAAGLIDYVRTERGVATVEVNVEPSALTAKVECFVQGPASCLMGIVQRARQLKETRAHLALTGGVAAGDDEDGKEHEGPPALVPATAAPAEAPPHPPAAASSGVDDDVSMESVAEVEAAPADTAGAHPAPALAPAPLTETDAETAPSDESETGNAPRDSSS